MTAQNASSVAKGFLEHSTIPDPPALFQAYAHYLLDLSDAWMLPVPLGRIREQHCFQRRKAKLHQRGFLFGKEIFVNSDDLTTVQRFTEAHELMESLAKALRVEKPSRLSTDNLEGFEKKKEKWCERGAAELLMPARLFFPKAKESGLTLAAACQLACFCETSLTATVRRMLKMDFTTCIFALLKEGHKKSEYVPSKVGQGVLWGKPEDWDPPAELRVWKYWRSPQVKARLFWNESFPRDATVYRTLTMGVPGQVYQGHDKLNLEQIKEVHHTESMLVRIDGTPVVMVLIHL